MTEMQIDRDQAQRFLALLDPAARAFTFQTFDDNKARKKARDEALKAERAELRAALSGIELDNKLAAAAKRHRDPFASIIEGPFDQVYPRLKAFNEQGAGVYVTINATRLNRQRNAASVERVRAVFADLDGAPLAPAANCGLQPHAIIESSPGRYQVFWLVDGLAPTEFTSLQKSIIAKFNADPSVHDLPRVMRVPGFLHCKQTPTLSAIVKINDTIPPYSAAEVRTAFPAVSPSAGAILAPGFTGLGSNIASSNNPIPEGQRNSTLLAMASHLRGKGLSQSDIETLLLSRNQSQCTPPLDEAEVLSVARRYPQQQSAAGLAWAPPHPLPDALPPVEAFDPDVLLPGTLAPWVKDVAERMDCPIDFLGAAIMVACGSLIGARLGVRPKRVDPWHEVPNLWGIIIGRSGVKKTPAINEMLKPLRDLEAAAGTQHEHDMGLYRLSLTQHEQELAGKKTKAKSGKHTLTLEDTTQPPAPRERRYIVNDTTVEALGIILQDNPTGTLALQDELAGLLSKLDQEERRSERTFYLEAYNGKNRVTVDRITRGRVTIPRACLSILGTTQPDTLKNYLRATVRGGVGNDGLMQRFQLAVYPDRQTGPVRYVDRVPDRAAQEQVRQVFTQLDTLDPQALGADVSGEIPTLGFSNEAAPVVQQFLLDHSNIMRHLDAHSALISHYSKYAKTIPTLALIIHLAGGGAGPITLAAFEKALAWMHYLRSHVKRIYSSVSQGHHEAARVLSTKLAKKQLTDGFTLRDITRKGWAQLTEKEEVKEALELLIDLGWLRATEERTNGRPTVRYWINPHLNRE